MQKIAQELGSLAALRDSGIVKEAFWGGLGKTLSGGMRSFLPGMQRFGQGLTATAQGIKNLGQGSYMSGFQNLLSKGGLGRLQNIAPQTNRLGRGAQMMSPGTATLGAGGLATYGAGDMLFGGPSAPTYASQVSQYMPRY